MRRLTGTEFGMLGLAGVLFFFGADSIIHPTEMDVFHQATYRHVSYSVEHVSKTGSKIYGVLMILFGVGLVSAVLYGRRK